MKNKTVFFDFLLVLLILYSFSSCSSAPKRPAQIVTTHNSAVRQLDLANTEIERGNYLLAQSLIDEAWRLAVIIDSDEMRILVQLSMGNLSFYQGDEILAKQKWQDALDEATNTKNDELIALSKIYQTRGLLSYGTKETEAARAKKAIETLNIQMDILKKSNPLYIAYAYNLMGFAYKQLKQWKDSENAFLSASKMHEDLLYLELTAYDWYAIASVKSMSGQTDDAIDAIQKSLVFDRRAENSYGIAMDYMALGDIYKKVGKNEDATKAYQRSADIFSAASMFDNVKIVQKKMELQK